MKKKRFSMEQIVAVLKQAELGVPVAEVIRKAGISGLRGAARWSIICAVNIGRASGMPAGFSSSKKLRN